MGITGKMSNKPFETESILIEELLAPRTGLATEEVSKQLSDSLFFLAISVKRVKFCRAAAVLCSAWYC